MSGQYEIGVDNTPLSSGFDGCSAPHARSASESDRLVLHASLGSQHRSATLDSSTNSTLATTVDHGKYELNTRDARRKSCGVADVAKHCGIGYEPEHRARRNTVGADDDDRPQSDLQHKVTTDSPADQSFSRTAHGISRAPPMNYPNHAGAATNRYTFLSFRYNQLSIIYAGTIFIIIITTLIALIYCLLGPDYTFGPGVGPKGMQHRIEIEDQNCMNIIETLEETHRLHNKEIRCRGEFNYGFCWPPATHEHTVTKKCDDMLVFGSESLEVVPLPPIIRECVKVLKDPENPHSDFIWDWADMIYSDDKDKIHSDALRCQGLDALTEMEEGQSMMEGKNEGCKFSYRDSRPNFLSMLGEATRAGFTISLIFCIAAIALYVCLPKLLSTRTIVHINTLLACFLQAMITILKTPIIHSAYGTFDSDNCGNGTHAEVSEDYDHDQSYDYELAGNYTDYGVPDDVLGGLHAPLLNSSRHDYITAPMDDGVVPDPRDTFSDHYANHSMIFITCRSIITLEHYAVVAKYCWILIEAMYLHALVFVVFLDEKQCLRKFLVFGWCIPLVPLLPWTFLRWKYDEQFCWDATNIATIPYEYILDAPGVCIITIIVLLWIHILWELWKKIRQTGSLHSWHIDQSRPSINSIFGTESSRIRADVQRLVKSACILFPLLAIDKIIFLFIPASSKAFDDDHDPLHPVNRLYVIRISIELFFTSLQGFFVSILYCFGCSDVQEELRWQFRKRFPDAARALELRWNKRCNAPRGSTATQLTSFSETNINRYSVN